MLIRNLGADDGVAFQCHCRTHTFSRREMVNAFGADTPLEGIGLRYRCSRCDMPAHRAWVTAPEPARDDLTPTAP